VSFVVNFFAFETTSIFTIYLDFAAHTTFSFCLSVADAPFIVGLLFFYRYLAPTALLIGVKRLYRFPKDVFVRTPYYFSWQYHIGIAIAALNGLNMNNPG
jgi:hypothetical protein